MVSAIFADTTLAINTETDKEKGKVLFLHLYIKIYPSTKVLLNSLPQSLWIHFCVPYVNNTNRVRRRIVAINQFESSVHQMAIAIDTPPPDKQRLQGIRQRHGSNARFGVDNLHDPSFCRRLSKLSTRVCNTFVKNFACPFLPYYLSHGYLWYRFAHICSEEIHFSGDSIPASTSSMSASISATRCSSSFGLSV